MADDLCGRRCFKNKGQIYFGDVSVSEDGSCLRHGQGLQVTTATTVAGDSVEWARYEGAFKDDKMTGTGCYRCHGTIYQGGFADGTPHGRGRLTWPEGSYYEGAWKEGQMTGQGSFYSAYDGFAMHGKFVRNCVQTHDGTWINVVQKREVDRASRLRIGAQLPPVAGGPAPASESLLPVLFCTPEALHDQVTEVLDARGRVPLILPAASCPRFGGERATSAAPLWCLEQGSQRGALPETTVHLLQAAAEKRRRRDHAQLFRDAIREALLSYRPFCLVFPDSEGEHLPGDGDPLPEALCLDEFLDPTALPLDLFDLRHLHTSLGIERFLPLEKRSANVPAIELPSPGEGSPKSVPAEVTPGGEGGEEAEGAEAPGVPHPPMLAPAVLYLLRFVLCSLRCVGSDWGEEEVRGHAIRRFAKHVPLHRVAVIVVGAAEAEVN